MATSSNFSTSNQYIKYRIIVTENSYSVANNTSNVTVKVQAWRTNQGYETYGTGTCYVNIDGTTSVSETTKAKLSAITKKMWEDGKLNNSNKIGKPSWNSGITCDNISITRRSMFSSVEVYKDDVLVVTFRSVTDLDEWTKDNEIPGLTYSTDKAKRKVQGKKTTHLMSANIHRAIRNNAIYRGLKFKKCLPLPPEMGVMKWENCWNGEIPNQQPSQPLTKLEGSETNS